ncbi:MAG: fibronectin type III domain-containing protein [Candidatus Peribacteraceae bacterium]|nr:fibronectin type III domain-containing protein [Candidatus Peribacteraceae bacterium]
MNKNTYSLLLGILFLPATVLAANVNVLDTVAGLATEVVTEGLTPDERVALTLVSPTGNVLDYELNTGAEGIAHTWVAGRDLETAGVYEVSVERDSEQEIAGTLTVHPDSVDMYQSFIEVEQDTVRLGEDVYVAVVLLDRYGNPLAGRTAELISSRSSDIIETLTRETDTDGTQQFVIRPLENGQLSLRALDLISGVTIHDNADIFAGNIERSMGGPLLAYSAPSAPRRFYQDTRPSNFGASVLGQVGSFQEIGKFNMEIGSQDIRVNEAESMTITAMDTAGGRFFDYEGTVYMATTDPLAELPKDGVITYKFEDQGIKRYTLGLTFGSVGNHLIILTRSPNEVPEDPCRDSLGCLEVEVTSEKPSEPAKQNIVIASPRKDSILGETEITVSGNGPAFINIIVSGGTEEVEGETSRDGDFSIPISLDKNLTEHTLQVREYTQGTSSSRFESEPITIKTDITAPKIEKITFTPDNPVEESDVLMIVETEPNVASISGEFNGEPINLTSSDPSTGKYQTLITVPAAGVFNATVTVTDELGNSSQDSASLPVSLKGLPIVQNVIAEAQINAIALRWDPVENAEIDAYRIYVGTDPQEFLYTLDTDRPTAAATVAGLHPGTIYYFAVTSLQGERESEGKSETVSATVLGVKLDVTPGDGSLFVEWSSLQQDIPLSSFILEYGTEPDQFTEQRSLNGDLRAYTLRDLINSISYYLKLTPITTTGELLTDLAADGQGTPIGAGYTASPSDPAPFPVGGIFASAGDGGRSDGPPPKPVKEIPLSEQGIPNWMLWSIILASIVTFYAYVKHRKQRQMTQAFYQAMNNRYTR